MTSPSPRTLPGIAASPGVGIGTAIVIQSSRLPVPLRRLEAHEVDREVLRLREALLASRKEVELVHDELSETQRRAYGLILEAHRLLLEDRFIWDRAERAIRSERIGAEWAVRRTLDTLEKQLRSAGPTHFRERAEDLEHVGRHLLRELLGRRSPPTTFPGRSVLIADDLSPTEAAKLFSRGIAAVAIERGNPTSHTALLARAHDLPAVVGVRGLLEHVEAGEEVVVDGLRGEVSPRPDTDQREAALRRSQRYRTFRGKLRTERADGPACTRDEVPIHLLANVEFPAEARIAAQEGAEAIGLFRTEFLYMGRRTPPDEHEQLIHYLSILEATAPRPVVLRTVDLGADKMPGLPRTQAERAAGHLVPGIRGLRLTLDHPESWNPQLRAVLRAAARGPLRLLFPMVPGPGALRAAKRHVERVAEGLQREGIAHRIPAMGAMVEIPAAALRAEALAAEADFLSVGSNDLVQYTLAASREAPDTADFADPLDPAVLTLLARVTTAGEARGVPVTLCGDLASDLLALPLMVGLGFRRLSLPPPALPLVRAAVRLIEAKRATETAREALRADSAMEVRGIVWSHFDDTLGEMWTEQGLGAPRS